MGEPTLPFRPEVPVRGHDSTMRMLRAHAAALAPTAPDVSGLVDTREQRPVTENAWREVSGPPIIAHAPTPSAGAVMEADVLAPGDVLGGVFEIRRRLGYGGMGQVYEANDRALMRTVALKVPWHGAPASTLVNEARALAAIRHPGVVAVYGLGWRGTMPFLIMERIYGATLGDHLEELAESGLRLEVREALDILTGLADALGAVHSAGMAHRDVKPANLFLPPNRSVVLGDLGIFMPESHSDVPLITGSPAYMAPETITNGHRRGNLFLVDVYAVGILAFEILTGHVPFDAPTTRSTLEMHLHAPVPDVRRARPDVPERLAMLVSEMLAKAPERRPHSMESIVWELRAIARAMK